MAQGCQEWWAEARVAAGVAAGWLWLPDRVGSLARADRGQDDREARFMTIGMVEHRLLLVSYTPAGGENSGHLGTVGSTYERRRYHNENQR